MKSFETRVIAHINANMPATLDPLQFAYRSNRATEDDISIAIHTTLTHLDKRNTYVRMLFIDYSSAFNTIVPSKLRALVLDTILCNWILYFLTGRPQAVRIGNNIFFTPTLNTGAPQWCVLSPCFYTTPTPSSSFLTTPPL
jgi:hypothetical protein